MLEQRHLIIWNKFKNQYKFLISINFYKFRYRSAIYRVSTKSKVHQTNTPMQVLIALTKCIKILKFQKL